MTAEIEMVAKTAVVVLVHVIRIMLQQNQQRIDCDKTRATCNCYREFGFRFPWIALAGMRLTQATVAGELAYRERDRRG
jgi:hypothetical protein